MHEWSRVVEGTNPARPEVLFYSSRLPGVVGILGRLGFCPSTIAMPIRMRTLNSKPRDSLCKPAMRPPVTAGC